ncbi:helix-turn-helix domain-containing protein [Streptacidiphilus sp. PAMC 29251]
MSQTERDDRTADSADPYSDFRGMTDARALRALAHPIRIALLEAVGVSGPLTATEAARIVGGTVSNVSYHLRTLAKYDYVVEAEGGTGRDRPWKIGAVGMRIDPDSPDPAVSHASRALGDVVSERWQGRLRHYRDHRDEYPEEVRAASGSSQFVVFGTAAEVEQAQAEIGSILMRFTHRVADATARPEGAVPFEMLLFTHPFETVVRADPAGPVGPNSATSQEG